MSIGVLTGLTMQAAAIVALLAVLRRRIFTNIGAILVLAMVLYHGIGEAAQTAFRSHARFRSEAPASAVEAWVLLVSVAIVLYTVVYLATLGRSRSTTVVKEEELQATLRLFDWRIVLLLVAPLIVATAIGRGLSPSADPGVPLPGQGNPKYYVTSGLSAQFLVLGVVLVGYGLIVRTNGRWFLRVIAATALPCALVGQRSIVAGVAVLIVYAVARHGITPTRRQMLMAVGMVVIAAVVISVGRAQAGRTHFAQGKGPEDRISALLTGLRALGGSGAREQIADDYVYRVDGNAWGALLLDGMDRGVKPVGLVTFRNNFLLAVPSFLNPSKLEASALARNEKAYINDRFGLSSTVDRLPTHLGTLFAYYGAPGLFVGAILLGAAFGLTDRWLGRGHGPARLIISLGLLTCVLSYETTFDVYPITLRGILLLVGFVAALQFVRATGRRLRKSLDPRPTREAPVLAAVGQSGARS